jgi:hypothetical protein
MDLDVLLLRYFDTVDIESVGDARLAGGEEQLRIDFAVEKEPGRRFALWTLMHALGIAPQPEDSFKDPKLQRVARDYVAAAGRLAPD